MFVNTIPRIYFLQPKKERPNYKILCVKGKRGVILLGDFWPKSDPNGKEDTPHVRIIMEGDCS
jgi:hypothetical protein